MSGIIIAGIISGCLYALVALGLVLIFRTTGAVNFAQGDVGSLGAFGVIGLSSGLWAHLPVGVGVVIGLLIAGLANVVIYLCIIRFLEGRSADLVTTLVATLGMSEVIEGILPNFFGYNPYRINLFPNLPSLHLLGVAIPFAGIAIVASTAVALAIFAFVLYRTRVGLALKMGASNARLSELSGVPVFTLKIVLWFIAGVVAGWGVILFSAYDNLSTTSMGEFLLFSAIAASWGAFRSIPWTLAGAIITGVVTNIVARYSPVSLGQTSSFVLLLLVFLVMQKRGDPVITRMDLERIFGRHVRAAYARRPKLAVGEWIVISGLAVLLLLFGGSYTSSLLLSAGAYAIVLVGLAFSIRYGGRLNLAGGAYALIGAYFFGVTANRGWNFFESIGVAVIVGAACGLLLGAITLRLETIYFVNLGLVLSAAVGEIVLLAPGLTGGGEGLSISAPFGSQLIFGQPVLNVLVITVGLVLFGAYLWYGRSQSAARTVISGADTRLARASGLKSGSRLVLVECIAGSTIALGGAFVGLAGSYISGAQFGVSYSNALIAAIILGGAWGVVGLAVGAFFGAVIPVLLGSLSTWEGVINGAVLVLVVVLFPAGVEGGLASLYGRIASVVPASGRPRVSRLGDASTNTLAIRGEEGNDHTARESYFGDRTTG